MFEGLTWLWTIVIGGLAGFFTDLFDRVAKNGVFGGVLSGMVGGFVGGLVLQLFNWPTEQLAMILLVSMISGVAAVYIYRAIVK